MRRRDYLRAMGLAGGLGLAGTGSAATAESEYDTYQFLGEAPAPGAEELVVHGRWAYVASNGLTTVDLREPTVPTPAAKVRPHHDGDTLDVNVDDYVTASGERRTIAGVTQNSGQAGVTFFDVTDPTAPEEVSFYRAADHVHNMFLEDGYAYLSISDGDDPDDGSSFYNARMVVVDVTDPTDPQTLEGPPGATDASDISGDEVGTNGAWMLRDARPDMGRAGVNPLHDLYVQDGLAYLAFWDAGIVVVDVTQKTRPVAVAHFGAVPYADTDDAGKYITGAKSNAHYVQPTPDGDYTFVGAETFPGPAIPPGTDQAQPSGDHGGIRVFDTSNSSIATLANGGTAVYPEADGVADTLAPSQQDPIVDHDGEAGDGEAVQYASPETTNSKNAADMVAYIPAPEQPDDAALTSHNFDVTETKLFTSWYQGGIRAYDISDPTTPEELAAFAPDGMAFWTAENLAAEQGATYYTVGSDIGKGAVVLELTKGSQLLP